MAQSRGQANPTGLGCLMLMGSMGLLGFALEPSNDLGSPISIAAIVGSVVVLILALYLFKLAYIMENPSSGGGSELMLATTHPNVPTDLFSKRFLPDNGWWHCSQTGLSKLAAQQGNSVSIRNQQTVDWLCQTGDQLSHSVLSALAHLSENELLPKFVTSDQRKMLFAVLFEYLVAEMYDSLVKQGRPKSEVEAFLACLPKGLFGTEFESTHCGEFLKINDPDERLRAAALVGAVQIGTRDPAVLQVIQQAAAILRLKATMLLNSLD